MDYLARVHHLIPAKIVPQGSRKRLLKLSQYRLYIRRLCKLAQRFNISSKECGVRIGLGQYPLYQLIQIQTTIKGNRAVQGLAITHIHIGQGLQIAAPHPTQHQWLERLKLSFQWAFITAGTPGYHAKTAVIQSKKVNHEAGFPPGPPMDHISGLLLLRVSSHSASGGRGSLRGRSCPGF